MLEIIYLWTEKSIVSTQPNYHLKDMSIINASHTLDGVGKPRGKD